MITERNGVFHTGPHDFYNIPLTAPGKLRQSKSIGFPALPRLGLRTHCENIVDELKIGASQ